MPVPAPGPTRKVFRDHRHKGTGTLNLHGHALIGIQPAPARFAGWEVGVVPESLRSNADDRLALDPLGRIERGHGVVEGRDLAMSVRTRPSRTRWPISLSSARSDTTTKSTADPSAGRACAGQAIVTSVPPARTRPADRVPMSPPKTSKTRSTPPTSSSASLSRSTNPARRSRAPSTAGSASGADDVRARLMCELGCHRSDYAGRAVHEDALPRRRRPWSDSSCHAVRPDITRPAPTVK